MAAALDDLLVTYLAAAGLGLVKNTSLFACAPRSLAVRPAAQCVFVWLDGGFPPERTRDSTASIRRPAITVQVYSAPDAFGTGLTLARAVLDACERAPLSSAIDVTVNQSEPAYLGQDDGPGPHVFGFSISALQRGP